MFCLLRIIPALLPGETVYLTRRKHAPMSRGGSFDVSRHIMSESSSQDKRSADTQTDRERDAAVCFCFAKKLQEEKNPPECSRKPQATLNLRGIVSGATTASTSHQHSVETFICEPQIRHKRQQCRLLNARSFLSDTGRKPDRDWSREGGDMGAGLNTRWVLIGSGSTRGSWSDQ